MSGLNKRVEITKPIKSRHPPNRVLTGAALRCHAMRFT